MFQFTNPITAIATGVLALGKSWIDHKKDLVVAERNLEIAKVNAKAKLAEQALTIVKCCKRSIQH